MAKGYWGPEYPEQHGHWYWDDDRYVLHLCDMDCDTCDPCGHAGIRPVEDDECLLFFVICLGGLKDIDLGEFVFSSPGAAKAFLDPLLACSTPPLPGYYPGDDDWTNPDR
jgi:hypothetical protein